MLEKRRYHGNPMFPLLLMVLALLGYLSVYTIYFETDVHMSPSPGVFILLQTNLSLLETPFVLSSLPRNDSNKLVNLTNFKFLMNNSVCNKSSPLIITLVHSATRNIEQRNSIRRTWGSLVSDEFKVLFLIGESSNKKVQENLALENIQYKDMIQGNFIDSYRNLTYKHVMAFKWTIYFCPNVRYILKTDDDVFVNTPALLDYLKDSLSPYGSRRLIACKVWYRARVVRSFRSKWRVTYRQYNQTYYPPFCAGWAILYSPDVIFNLYKYTQDSEYFWIDDIHITGSMVEKMNYRHFDISHYIADDSYFSKKKFFLFGPKQRSVQNIYDSWELLKTQNVS